MIWSVFALSFLEIGGILWFALRDLIKVSSTQFYVHRDSHIVFFVTFAIITLFFKLTILTSL